MRSLMLSWIYETQMNGKYIVECLRKIYSKRYYAHNDTTYRH